MNKVRFNYINIMSEIAKMDLLQDILREISGNPRLELQKDSDDLWKDILYSEYALS